MSYELRFIIYLLIFGIIVAMKSILSYCFELSDRQFSMTVVDMATATLVICHIYAFYGFRTSIGKQGTFVVQYCYCIVFEQNSKIA